MKTLNITFEDSEYELLAKRKGSKPWREYFLELAKQNRTPEPKPEHKPEHKPIKESKEGDPHDQNQPNPETHRAADENIRHNL